MSVYHHGHHSLVITMWGQLHEFYFDSSLTRVKSSNTLDFFKFILITFTYILFTLDLDGLSAFFIFGNPGKGAEIQERAYTYRKKVHMWERILPKWEKMTYLRVEP